MTAHRWIIDIHDLCNPSNTTVKIVKRCAICGLTRTVVLDVKIHSPADASRLGEEHGLQDTEPCPGSMN